MPYGLSFSQYVTVVTLSIGAMLAGGSVVHSIYKPDLTIPDKPVPRPEAKVNVALVEPRGYRNTDKKQQ
eukprot:m.9946 g.9946  ORF g.9946 m.9946 type:complete len:69 (+) comp4170_c0_seq1:268-474(+)